MFTVAIRVPRQMIDVADTCRVRLANTFPTALIRSENMGGGPLQLEVRICGTPESGFATSLMALHKEFGIYRLQAFVDGKPLLDLPSPR